MKSHTSSSLQPPSLPARADLLRQARGVFGVDSTIQPFGTGGPIHTEDGRQLRFEDDAGLARLIAREEASSLAQVPSTP